MQCHRLGGGLGPVTLASVVAQELTHTWVTRQGRGLHLKCGPAVAVCGAAITLASGATWCTHQMAPLSAALRQLFPNPPPLLPMVYAWLCKMQVKKCADAGADIVRITVQGKKEAEACMKIREQLFKDRWVQQGRAGRPSADPHGSP